MLGFLKILVSFIPNLITHYEQKNVLSSSEGVAGLAGAIGSVLVYFHFLPQAEWDKWGLGLVSYVALRVLSKGLAAHPASTTGAA